MSEHATSPNLFRRLVATGTTIAAFGSLAGCTSSNKPELNAFSNCDETITSIHILDDAVIRSEPTTGGGAEAPSNVITKIEFTDDGKYNVVEYLEVSRQLGGACIRVAQGYGGDGNGRWFGVPGNELADKILDDGTKNTLKQSSDGYVWVNNARAEAITK